MSQFDQQWRNLVALARQAPASDVEAPFGFATRVAAQAALAPAPWASLERFAVRGLLAASTCCVAAVAFNYFGRSSEAAAESQLEEAVNTVLELS